MSLEPSHAETICAETCGAACCEGGAFVRPVDAARLRRAGYEAAVPREGWLTRTTSEGDCVLLGPDGRCQAYEHRPLDCRLFPFGYTLDDAAECAHVVIAGCPLAEQYAAETTETLTAEATEAISRFEAATLRAYDRLEFTEEPEPLATIPYSDIPIDL